jgi:hypothetical protein
MLFCCGAETALHVNQSRLIKYDKSVLAAEGKTRLGWTDLWPPLIRTYDPLCSHCWVQEGAATIRLHSWFKVGKSKSSDNTEIRALPLSIQTFHMWRIFRRRWVQGVRYVRRRFISSISDDWLDQLERPFDMTRIIGQHRQKQSDLLDN